MAAVAPQHPTSTRSTSKHTGSDVARGPQGDRSPNAPLSAPVPSSAPQQQSAAAVPAKKAKSKKSPDPMDAEKQLAAKIAQLEQEKVGDREIEAEIGG